MDSRILYLCEVNEEFFHAMCIWEFILTIASMDNTKEMLEPGGGEDAVFIQNWHMYSFIHTRSQHLKLSRFSSQNNHLKTVLLEGL